MKFNVNELTAANLSGVDPIQASAARSWEVQVRGAYALLYPLIARDFRGKLDCTTCHTELQVAYISHLHSPTAHLHGQLSQPRDTLANSKIVNTSGPFGVERDSYSNLASKGFRIPRKDEVG